MVQQRRGCARSTRGKRDTKPMELNWSLSHSSKSILQNRSGGAAARLSLAAEVVDSRGCSLAPFCISCRCYSFLCLSLPLILSRSLPRSARRPRRKRVYTGGWSEIRNARVGWINITAICQGSAGLMEMEVASVGYFRLFCQARHTVALYIARFVPPRREYIMRRESELTYCSRISRVAAAWKRILFRGLERRPRADGVPFCFLSAEGCALRANVIYILCFCPVIDCAYIACSLGKLNKNLFLVIIVALLDFSLCWEKVLR